MGSLLDHTGMNETFFLDPEYVTTTQADLKWQSLLDALVRGHIKEEDFIEEIANLRESTPSATWNILTLLHQRYRRGEMPAALFRSVETKLAQFEPNPTDEGMTDDLPRFLAHPETRSSPANADPDTRTAPEVPHHDRQPPPPVEIGRILRDRYVLESNLGSGGMGTVFKASDRFRFDLPEGDRYVAIKILHEAIRSRPEVLRNLKREFYCAQKLSHKNIVRVYELDRDGEIAFFTMELLEGKLLSTTMRQLHPMPVARPIAWPIILDVSAGLAHAHERNVIHADLKPQNILITNVGEVRLLDFGTSSTAAHQRASAGWPVKAGSSAVTPAYASCELLAGQAADLRDDIYALACLSYELLAGEHPFKNKRSNDARTLDLKPRRPSGLSARQWRALCKGLAWERKDRPSCVRDWIAELAPKSSLLILPGRGNALATKQPPFAPQRAIWLLSVLLILVLTWAATSLPFKGPTAPGVSDVTPLALSVSNSEPTPTPPSASVDNQVRISATTTAPAPRSEVLVPTTKKTLAHNGERPAAAREIINTINLEAKSYSVRRGQNYAEIRVYRTFGFGNNASFDWWTEPNSAQAGLDYLPQAASTQVFSKGQRSTSVFVKVIANRARTSTGVFYVVIGNPSKGNSIGRVTRAAVKLPPLQ
jgi:serine/threonine protein kinase